MRHYFRADLKLLHMSAEDWGLNGYEGAEGAAALLSNLCVKELVALTERVNGGATIAFSAVMAFNNLISAFKEEKLGSYGAADELTRAVLVALIEEFVEKRYGFELEFFWEGDS